MSEPTKEVQVDMSFKGHNFTTFVIDIIKNMNTINMMNLILNTVG